MDGDAHDDECDAGDLGERRDLGEDDDADHRCCGGEQRDHEGVGLRLRRAMASWSQTYGTTDDETPTPTAAASATGSTNAGTACPMPIGSAMTAATSIASAKPVDAAARRGLCATRWPSTM